MSVKIGSLKETTNFNQKGNESYTLFLLPALKSVAIAIAALAADMGPQD